MTKKKQIIFSSLLGIVLLGVIFWPKHREVEPLDEVDVTDSVEVQEIVYKYGIPIDDYEVDFGVVAEIRIFRPYWTGMEWEKERYIN